MIAFRCSKTAEYYEVPENFTIESWGDLADDLLCAGVNASGIRDALVDVWPDYQWFAHTKQKVSYFVCLMAIRLAFFMGYEYNKVV